MSLEECWACGLPVFVDPDDVLLAELAGERVEPPDCWTGCTEPPRQHREPPWARTHVRRATSVMYPKYAHFYGWKRSWSAYVERLGERR